MYINGHLFVYTRQTFGILSDVRVLLQSLTTFATMLSWLRNRKQTYTSTIWAASHLVCVPYCHKWSNAWIFNLFLLKYSHLYLNSLVSTVKVIYTCGKLSVVIGIKVDRTLFSKETVRTLLIQHLLLFILFYELYHMWCFVYCLRYLFFKRWA